MADKPLRNSWAVLIGINSYKSDRIGDLRGCVNDVEDIAVLLQSHLATTHLHITKLTSPADDEQQQQLPTYANIVAALGEIEHKARPGDFVYIHFSGHGSRLLTVRPDPSGSRWDEVLLLCGERHMRDFELGGILNRISSRGLVVLTVLDCCHSGGADRVDEMTRGVDGMSLMESSDIMINRGSALRGSEADQKEITRNGTVLQSPWLGARNYTVLAACEPDQSAGEVDHDGKSNGRLTHAMVEFFQSYSSGILVSYKTMHRDLRERIQLRTRRQTPMVLGEVDRALFESQSISAWALVSVQRVSGDEVFLDLGQPHGVSLQDVYAIYESFEGAERLAEITITRFQGQGSWGFMRTRNDRVRVGCWGKLVSHGRQIDLQVGVECPKLLGYLQAIQQHDGIRADFVEYCPLNASSNYSILAREEHYEVSLSKHRLVPSIPLISAADPKAAEKTSSIFRKVRHFQFIKQLQNPYSTLKNDFNFSVYKPGEDREAKSLEIRSGEVVSITFENRSKQTLYYTILDLTPDWAVDIVVPEQNQESELIEAGKSETVELEVTIPAELMSINVTEIEESLKVIVTTKPTWFGQLKSEAIPADGDFKLNVGSLEHLHGPEKDRHAILKKGGVFSYGDWQTDHVTIKTRT